MVNLARLALPAMGKKRYFPGFFPLLIKSKDCENIDRLRVYVAYNNSERQTLYLGMKKLLILSIAVNVIVIGWFIVKRIMVKSPAGFASFASNPVYSEQVNISAAYNTPCEVAFLGDSHIFKCHWSELLGFTVSNRGIGSDVTEGMYRRLSTVIRPELKTCFIMSGANDIEQKRSVDSIMYWYGLIIYELKKAGIRPVIMLETPVGKDYNGSERFNGEMTILNNRLKDLAETISISIEPADLQNDGIHLTASGYKKWKAEIAEYLAAR
jgi:hypothetical protein